MKARTLVILVCGMMISGLTAQAQSHVRHSVSVPLTATAPKLVTGLEPDPKMVKAQADEASLTARCPDFAKLAKDLPGDYQSVARELSNYAPSCSLMSCQHLDKMRAAANKSAEYCHDQGLKLALNAKSACYYPKLKKNGSDEPLFKDKADFCHVFSTSESTVTVDAFWKSLNSKEDEQCIHFSTHNRDAGLIVRNLLDNGACAVEIGQDSFKCGSDGEDILKYTSAYRRYTKLKVQKEVMSAPLTDDCKISNAADAEAIWSRKDSVSVACSKVLSSSCEVAKKEASRKTSELFMATLKNHPDHLETKTIQINQSQDPVQRKVATDPSTQPAKDTSDTSKGSN